MTNPQDVLAHFVAEGAALDEVVADLGPEQWRTPTPAPGWTIAHQLAHLASMFDLAALAAADPARFTDLTSRLSDDFAANVERAMAPYLDSTPDVLLGRWRESRATAAATLAAADPATPLPWLVNPLPPAVIAAAGIMELFGHGQDILDALDVRREPTDHIGPLVGFIARTWTFGYLSRNLPVPDVEFRFEVTAPSGALWAFGPEDAAQRITGPALDLCLLATRRRHPADLALTATGADAEGWLSIAQCYRGPAGEGRTPGQFAAVAGRP